MRRELKLTSTKLPSSEELLFHELGHLIEQNANMSSILKDKFKPNVNQKRMFDIIETSLVPKGKWIHMMCYGGTGGGKTWGVLVYALQCMLSYPGVNVLGVRATVKDLKNTIYKDVKNILDRFGVPYTKNDTDLKIRLENGSEFWMCSDKALTPASSDKSDSLGGTQFTIVILEEADSISEELQKTIPGRMRQNVGDIRKVIFYDCNPPGKRHWTYQKWWGDDKNPNDPTSRWRACHFPMEGNVEHTGQDYIDAVDEDYGDDPVLYKRMRLGHFGSNTKGKPIFIKEFSESRHVWKGDDPLPWTRGLPLIRGWDFGYDGTGLVILQDDLKTRRIKVLYAHVETNCLLDVFCDEVLPEIRNKFKGAQWIDFCDPAGAQRDTRTSRTCIDILKDHGIHAKFRRTHSVAYGINVIMRQLRLNLNGQPVFIIDPECEALIEAFAGGYANKKDVADQEINPVKDGYYDHIMDALRYAMVNIREYKEELNPNADDVRHEWKSLGGHVGPTILQPGPRQRSAPMRSRSRIR